MVHVQGLALPSRCGKVMKATIAQYNAESLLTQREQVGGRRRLFFLGVFKTAAGLDFRGRCGRLMDWLSPEKWCLKDYFLFEMAPFYGTCWFSGEYTPDPMCKAAFLPLQTLKFLMCPEACEFGGSFFEQDRNVSSNFTFCILGEHLNIFLNRSSDLDSARHLKVSGSRITAKSKQKEKRGGLI